MKSSSKAILFGVTIPVSARVFLAAQLNLLVDRTSDLHLVYGIDGDGPAEDIDDRVTQHQVHVRRNPSPLSDLRGLQNLVSLMRNLRPKMVVMGTPKMGMLGLLAAWLLNVDQRVYILYGLRFEGAKGLSRAFLKAMERVSMFCSTEVIALSNSNLRESVALGLVKSNKIHVLGSGSIGGVDLSRFNKPTREHKRALRSRFELPSEALVVGFLGRLTPDKGLEDLAKVWAEVHLRHPDSWLLLVGPDEATNPKDRVLKEKLASLPNVQMHGRVSDPENALRSMDVQLLLTKREGIGMVLIEGAACGVPAVTTRVSGAVDAVSDQVTGTIVPLGDVDAAVAAVSAYLTDSELRNAHSIAGVDRVEREFDSARVNDMWVDHLLNLVRANK